ncbi:MAG: galactokinase [Spirochaetes bacterium]|nr:galactokinase [Spirochaetota bacterium]MBU1081083.1 galactokinase [Spirochaetota bacterium]
MHDPESLYKLPRSREGRKLLGRWYGDARVPAEAARWEALAELTLGTYDVPEAAFVSSPGRTELGGNHTDHNDGKVLCAAVHLDALACVAPRDDLAVELFSEGWEEPFRVDLGELEPKPEERGKPESLIRGVAAAIARRGGMIGGFRGRMTSAVPAGSGLSSSAAVEVLFGQIQNALYNQNRIPPAEIAMASKEAENLHFGKPCGLMDQMACALGGISAIDFGRPDKPRWSRVGFDFEKAGYVLAVVDTGGSHADLTEHYAAIPAEMRAVAELFGLPSLRKLSLDKLIRKSAEIREKAGDRALLRAMHFVAENERAEEMAETLDEGRLKKFLKLVKRSGDSSWRLLQNVTPPGAERDQPLAVAIELSKAFIRKDGAARVHGGGFAGTIQAYLKADQAEEYADYMDARFGSGATTILHIRPDGAGEAIL